jgi:hypothetical protein
MLMSPSRPRQARERGVEREAVRISLRGGRTGNRCQDPTLSAKSTSTDESAACHSGLRDESVTHPPKPTRAGGNTMRGNPQSRAKAVRRRGLLGSWLGLDDRASGEVTFRNVLHCPRGARVAPTARTGRGLSGASASAAGRFGVRRRRQSLEHRSVWGQCRDGAMPAAYECGCPGPPVLFRARLARRLPFSQLACDCVRPCIGRRHAESRPPFSGVPRAHVREQG